MIVSNSKKVIFLEVPKTGSMSLSSLIKSSDFFNENQDTVYGQHTLISEAISEGVLNYDIKDYKIYAFIRNPLDRVLSAWYHDFLRFRNETIKELTLQELRLEFDKSIHHNFIGSLILKKDQSMFYEDGYNIELLVFENYIEEISKVFKEYDLNMPKIPVKNVRRNKQSLVTVDNMLNWHRMMD